MKLTVFNSLYHLSLLAKLGDPMTQQPEVSRLIAKLYTSLFGQVVSEELEKEEIEQKTRVFSEDERGIYKGPNFKIHQEVVVVDLIRAGSEPAALFYHLLTEILDPTFVRQDHIMAERKEEGSGHVVDADLMAHKIGGSIEEALVFIPDPMGATGHSLEKVIEFYLKHYGRPKKFISVNLVIAPEFVEKLKSLEIPLSIYAARQDVGLTAKDYIYPGLGGVGEMISNTNL